MTTESDIRVSHEHGRHPLYLTINSKKYEWDHQYITGEQVKKLGEIPQEDELFLAVKKPYEDEHIHDDTRVDLARPGIEHFYSKKHEFIIIVNAREKGWKEEKISFKQVVELAFGTCIDNPDIVYTVTYKRGPKQNPEGTMVKGDSVYVKNKMLFNVTKTDKS